MVSIIRKQHVRPRKLARVKELRQGMTKTEQILWDYLRCNRLNDLHFRRQQVIDGYIVDFYCHSARLIVEVDGEVHEYQKEEDQKRDLILQEKGLKILRIKNEQVRSDLQGVLNKILEWI
jgi:very-short-patch-repair endonuclease